MSAQEIIERIAGPTVDPEMEAELESLVTLAFESERWDMAGWAAVLASDDRELIPAMRAYLAERLVELVAYYRPLGRSAAIERAVGDLTAEIEGKTADIRPQTTDYRPTANDIGAVILKSEV